MTWSAAALWGLLGGGLVEVFDLYTEIKRSGALPWSKQRARKRSSNRPPVGIYMLASALRLVMGCGVAAAAGASNTVSAAWVAVSIGIAAPLIIERLLKQVPLELPPPPPNSMKPQQTAPAMNINSGKAATHPSKTGPASDTPKEKATEAEGTVES